MRNCSPRIPKTDAAPRAATPYNKGKRCFSCLKALAVAVLAGAQTVRRTGFRTPCGARAKERFMAPSSIFSFLPASAEPATWGPWDAVQVDSWVNRAKPVPITPKPAVSAPAAEPDAQRPLA